MKEEGEIASGIREADEEVIFIWISKEKCNFSTLRRRGKDTDAFFPLRPYLPL